MIGSDTGCTDMPLVENERARELANKQHAAGEVGVVKLNFAFLWVSGGDFIYTPIRWVDGRKCGT